MWHHHFKEYLLEDEVEVLGGGQADEAGLGLVHDVYLIPVLLSICWINLGSHIVLNDTEIGVVDFSDNLLSIECVTHQTKKLALVDVGVFQDVPGINFTSDQTCFTTV